MNDCKEIRDVHFETMSCPIFFSLFIILVHWNFMKGYFLLQRFPKNGLSSSLKIHERLLEFKVVNKRREKIA